MTRRVLAGGPIHSCKAYGIDRYLAALRSVRQNGLLGGDFVVDIVLSDNSSESVFSALLSRRYPDIKVLRAKYDPDPSFPIRHRIVASQNQLREAVLSGGYDLFFSVECDVIVQADAIRRLAARLEIGLDAVQGIYYSSFDDAAWDREVFWLMGLALIKRSVLSCIEFRFDPAIPIGFSDAFFGHDMVARSVPFGFDSTVKGQHLWRVEGKSRGWDLIDPDWKQECATIAKTKNQSPLGTGP